MEWLWEVANVHCRTCELQWVMCILVHVHVLCRSTSQQCAHIQWTYKRHLFVSHFRAVVYHIIPFTPSFILGNPQQVSVLSFFSFFFFFFASHVRQLVRDVWSWWATVSHQLVGMCAWLRCKRLLVNHGLLLLFRTVLSSVYGVELINFYRTLSQSEPWNQIGLKLMGIVWDDSAWLVLDYTMVSTYTQYADYCMTVLFMRMIIGSQVRRTCSR